MCVCVRAEDFWPSIMSQVHTVGLSVVEAAKHEADEMDAVSAMAGLSVVYEKQQIAGSVCPTLFCLNH